MAHHPIKTVGGPLDAADDPDDVTIPDMTRLRQLLRVAEREETVIGDRHPTWVTELWWETDPPDPGGVSLDRQARWIAESLYELWRQRVSSVFLLGIRDGEQSGSSQTSLDSGLYFSDGKPKPAATAFRFPLVAKRVSRGLRSFGQSRLVPGGWQSRSRPNRGGERSLKGG